MKTYYLRNSHLEFQIVANSDDAAIQAAHNLYNKIGLIGRYYLTCGDVIAQIK